MFVCICVCAYVCLCWAFIGYAFVCMHVYVFVYTCMFVCVHAFLYVFMCVPLCVVMCVYLCVCMCLCMSMNVLCVCMCIFCMCRISEIICFETASYCVALDGSLCRPEIGLEFPSGGIKSMHHHNRHVFVCMPACTCMFMFVIYVCTPNNNS